MEFDYEHLGSILKLARTQKRMRQSDIEVQSQYRLRQPAISAIEHGETRLAVDTLVEYCNILGVRTDDVLDSFLTTPPVYESSGAIIDPYVVQIAEIFKDCSAFEKKTIIKIVQIIVELSRNQKAHLDKNSGHSEKM